MKYLEKLVLVGLAAISLWACSEGGARELTAASDLGSFDLAWNQATKTRFGIPPEVETRLGGKEWLLRRAVAVGSPSIRTAARFELAHTVLNADCEAAGALLRANAGHGAPRRMLEDLETRGCRQVLEESIAATEEALRVGRIPPNEITNELLERMRLQRDTLGGPSSEKPELTNAQAP
ncbi:MAG: hypothetical protein KJ058_01320 [Thermoanaerobaculia bacterium]|nr:hypothetical protein [Thermoanaerobaculia bacterium]